MLRIFFVSILSLLVANCSSFSLDFMNTKNTDFNCEGDITHASFDKNDNLNLLYKNKQYQLYRTISASGLKYRNMSKTNPVVFWIKGNDGFLEINKKRVNCHH